MVQIEIIKTRRFLQAYTRLDSGTRRTIDNKIDLLSVNPNHRSLHAHRLRQITNADVWSCYISINKRLLYEQKGGKIYLLEVGEHSIIDHVTRRFK